MSSGRSRSAGSCESAGSCGSSLGSSLLGDGFVVAGLERQIEVLPVRDAAQLGKLQHDAALTLEYGIVHGVQVGVMDASQALGEFGIVTVGVADHEFENVVPDLALASQANHLEPREDPVEGGHPPVS